MHFMFRNITLHGPVSMRRSKRRKGKKEGGCGGGGRGLLSGLWIIRNQESLKLRIKQTNKKNY